MRCTLGIFDFDLSFVYDSYPQPNEESDRPTLSIETMSTAAAALNAVLAAHSAFEVAGVGIGREGEGAAIELDTDASPIDGAKVLWDNNILGAPVYDKVKEEYVGFFDTRDMLSFMVTALKVEKGENEEMTPLAARMSESLATGIDSQAALAEDPTVAHLAAKNPFISCKDDSTLLEVSKTISPDRCHRVPIVDDTGKVSNIVSQSAIVKYLALKTPPDDLKETLEECGFPYRKDVLCINEDAGAADAFALMASSGRSGIAIVDEEGSLMGNTSARDIRFAALDEGRTAIDTDIISYLAIVRQATASKNDRYPITYVRETDTLLHTIALLAKTGYHRCFVVDKDKKPVGVVSVSDVVNFAISYE